MDAFLNWATNTSMGCYVMGSVLLALVMVLHLLSHRRLHGRHWMAVVTCLPFVNCLIVAYLLLESVTVVTGKPIVIGRRRG